MLDLDNIKKKIWDNLDYANFVCGESDDSKKKLSFGDYVISGINTNGDRVIGYGH